MTAGFGVSAASGSGGVLAQQSGSSVVAPRIEPVTTKRRGTGLRGHDPDRAFQGFTLFSPLPSSNRSVYLIDMEGNVVNTWNMPYPPGQSGYLTERGTLFFNGQSLTRATSAKRPTGATRPLKWTGMAEFSGN